MAYIRPVRAYEGETVEVRWTCVDGTTCYTRHTIPPKATREAVDQKAEEIIKKQISSDRE